jgi:broad-specificity NMP kinase
LLAHASYVVLLTDSHLQLQRELKKCMAQDPKVADQRISAADIDAIFGDATEDHATTAIEEQTKEKDCKSADDQKSELHKVTLFAFSLFQIMYRDFIVRVVVLIFQYSLPDD